MTNKIAIFLDDERYVEDVTWTDVYPNAKFGDDYSWKIVRCFDEMVELIDETNDWTNIIHISFDHDLGQYYHETGVEPTGYTCVKMLIDKCINLNIDPPNCSFHSMNPIGCENMKKYYDSYLKFRRSHP